MSKIDEIADQFTAAVRTAFSEVYESPADLNKLHSVLPTWSDRGVRLGWHDPDPGVVLVLTEFAWIRDPWSSTEDHQKWEIAMALLRNRGWNNVAFESINSAVHIVYWFPPDPWQSTLMKRLMEKRK